MPQITKIKQLAGRTVNIAAFEGLHYSDTDHAIIDIKRYLLGQHLRPVCELRFEYQEMPIGGTWDNADEVEMF